MKMSSSVKFAIDAFGLQVRRLFRVPESYSSEVWRLDLGDSGEVILKIPYSEVKYLREKHFLERLRKLMPVPELLNFWDGGGKIPGALLLSCLRGEPVSGMISETGAYRMGVLLGSLHKISAERYGQLESESSGGIQGSWESFLQKRYRLFRDDCRGVLDEGQVTRCDEVFRYLFDNLPSPGEPCIVHMDFRPGNILMDGETKITGLIDFESSRGGSPEIDFIKVATQIWTPWPITREPFLEGYGSVREIPDLERTLPFHLFCDALGSISWCIRRNQLGNTFHLESLHRLEDYLSGANLP